MKTLVYVHFVPQNVLPVKLLLHVIHVLILTEILITDVLVLLDITMQVLINVRNVILAVPHALTAIIV
jgi:hypothetical protein